MAKVAACVQRLNSPLTRSMALSNQAATSFSIALMSPLARSASALDEIADLRIGDLGDRGGERGAPRFAPAGAAAASARRRRGEPGHIEEGARKLRFVDVGRERSDIDIRGPAGRQNIATSLTRER